MRSGLFRHKVVTAAVGAGLVLTGTAFTASHADAAAGGGLIPDVSVAFKQNGIYAGDNAPGGQVTRRVKRNKPKEVFFKVQNDGEDPGSVTLIGDPGDSDLKLKYFIGNSNITQFIGDFDLSLAAGASRTVRVVIKAKPGFTDRTFGLFIEEEGNNANSDFFDVLVDVKPFQPG